MSGKVTYRELDEDDIYELLKLIKKIDLSLKQNYYLSPAHEINSLNKINIRRGFFDYSIFGYGEFHDSELASVILFSIPIQRPYLKYAELYFISYSYNYKNLLLPALKALKSDYNSLVKVKLEYIENLDNDILGNLIVDVGFKREYELEKEFQSQNLQEYSIEI